MADPVIVDCPAGEWTKVGTDIENAILNLHPNFHEASYIYTYRMTAEDAPLAADRPLEGVPIFDNRAPHPITAKAGEGIDCYVWCEGNAGRVILWN